MIKTYKREVSLVRNCHTSFVILIVVKMFMDKRFELCRIDL